MRTARQEGPRLGGGTEARPSALSETLWRHGRLIDMIPEIDAPDDYSFVVKRRGPLAKPWRWEIYRAGKSPPVKCSVVFFESMSEAAREGKKALADFLAKRAA
jgi:hypothetical protein